MDPSSDLGESVAALGIQFESLFKTIFGQDATIGTVFEIAGAALGMFIDLMHDLLRLVENTIIGFKVMGEYLEAWVNLDFEKIFNTDWAARITDSINAADKAKEAALNVRQYIAEWDRVRQLELGGHIQGIARSADGWERALQSKNNYLKSFLTGSPDNMERQLERMGLGKVFTPTGSGSTPFISTSSASSPSGGGGGSAAQQSQGLQGWIDEANRQAAILQRQSQLMAAGLTEEVAKSILSGPDAIQKADEALQRIGVSQWAHVNWFTDLFNQTAEGQRLIAERAEEATRLANETAEQARKQEQEILDKRKAAFESFSDSVKSVFGGIKDSIMSAFSLPDLGNSVTSITRNIQKLLARTKDFAKNITSLSKQGLSNDLLQQVIAAGPMEGGKLAAALAGAGGGFIGQLNQAYGEFGSIASGIAGVGTRSAFAGQQTVNNYSIEVKGGLATGSEVGRAVVNAIKDYERQSGAAWRA
jgi:hypothetical protein